MADSPDGNIPAWIEATGLPPALATAAAAAGYAAVDDLAVLTDADLRSLVEVAGQRKVVFIKLKRGLHARGYSSLSEAAASVGNTAMNTPSPATPAPQPDPTALRGQLPPSTPSTNTVPQSFTAPSGAAASQEKRSAALPSMPGASILEQSGVPSAPPQQSDTDATFNAETSLIRPLGHEAIPAQHLSSASLISEFRRVDEMQQAAGEGRRADHAPALDTAPAAARVPAPMVVLEDGAVGAGRDPYTTASSAGAWSGSPSHSAGTERAQYDPQGVVGSAIVTPTSPSQMRQWDSAGTEMSRLHSQSGSGAVDPAVAPPPAAAAAAASSLTVSIGAGLGPAAGLEAEAASLCDEMELLRSRTSSFEQPVASQAARLYPRLQAFAARALRLHAQAQALQSELDHKRRRLDAFHSEKLELQRMHEEHKMQSESVESLTQQRHSAAMASQQLEVEQARAALSAERAARDRERTEASALRGQLERRVAEKSGQVQRLQVEFEMAGEQIEREFEAQTKKLQEVETDLEEAETTVVEQVGENEQLKQRNSELEERWSNFEAEYHANIAALEQQISQQGAEMMKLRNMDVGGSASDGPAETELQQLNDELVEALRNLHRRNQQLEDSALAAQTEDLRRTNDDLNRQLEVKNRQVRDAQQEIERLEAYLSRLVRVHTGVAGELPSPGHGVSADEHLQLERDHGQLHGRFTSIMSAHDKLVAEHDTLHAEHRKLRAAKEQLESLCSEYEAELDTVLSDLHRGTADGQRR